MEIINIPNAKPAVPVVTDEHRRDADFAIKAMREAGIDPRKAYTNPMAQAVVLAWSRCEMSRAGMIHALRNLVILNPSLAAK